MEEPNLNYIKQLSDGDPIFEESIIGVLKKEFPEDFLNFKSNFKSNLYADAANTVHKIKHKIGLLGLEKGVKLASDFELELRNGTVTLDKQYVEVLEKIQHYLDNN